MIGRVFQALQMAQMVSAMKPRKAASYEAPRLANTDPMEGMAAASELSRYQYKDGSFYLGDIHSDHGVNFKAGINDDRHIFLAAGNAGGKGRSIIINNLLRWEGGTVNLDLKGELCSITAMRRGTDETARGSGTSVRQFLEHEVIALDPFKQVEGAATVYRANYNPLGDIDIKSDNAQAQIKKIAAACVVPMEGKNQWISDDASIILGGAIEAVLATEKPVNQTLPFVAELVTGDFEKLIDDLLSRDNLPVKGMAQAANRLLEDSLDGNERGYYKSCLVQNLIWLSEPQIREHLTASETSVKRIVQSGGDVFISVPPNRVDDLKGWLRLIVQTCINAKVELGVYQETTPTLFVLDEFAQLGKFAEIEKNAAFIRGYNCKMLCVIQNIGQIKQHYDKNWETFLGNAGAIIGFATNDLETEEYLANRTGKIMAWETSTSIGTSSSDQGIQGGTGNSKTVSQALRERQVRRHNEIHEECARDTMKGLVIPADGKPFFIQRKNYDDIPIKGIFDSPDFIRNWERNYSRGGR